MSPQKMKKEEECVAEMLIGGQIEPSDSLWSSPVVLVTKKDVLSTIDGSTMRLSRTPIPSPELTILWICWPVNSGSLLWTWRAVIGKFHCHRKLESRLHSRDTFWAVSVQGHDVRIVQCTGHIRETKGPTGHTCVTTVPVKCLSLFLFVAVLTLNGVDRTSFPRSQMAGPRNLRNEMMVFYTSFVHIA